MKPMYIYISGQYTVGDPVMNVRYAVETADKVIQMDDYPYVPHLSHLWHLVQPHSYEYWMGIDLAWLDKCDALIRMVDHCPGGSPGADREVKYAKSRNMLIFNGVNEYLQYKEMMVRWGGG